MTRTRDELKELLDELPDELIEDLMPLLLRMSEWEATEEILSDPDMISQIRASEADWDHGETVSWRDVQRDDL